MRCSIIVIGACILCFTTSCALLRPASTATVGVLECLANSNLEHKPYAALGSPSETDIIDRNIPFSLRVGNLTVNDAVANDVERCILRQVGILASDIEQAAKSDRKTREVEISAADAQLFSKELLTDLEDAAIQVQREAAPNKEVEISVAEVLVEEALKSLRSELLAEYTITVRMAAQSFELGVADKEVKISHKIRQAELGNPETRNPQWNQLLYRGSGVDIAQVDILLARTSLLSEAIQKQLDKLKKSTLLADTLGGLLGATPLGGFGEKVGKKFGERLDSRIYNLAKERYGPSFDIGTASFTMVTKATPQGAKANDEAWKPKEPDTTLFAGTRELRLKAKQQSQSEGAGIRDLILLKLDLEAQPVREL